MGLFSWNCKACRHPLLAPFNTDSVNAWMNDGVAILPSGSILMGSYDGYGRLDDHDINSETVYGDEGEVTGEPRVFHKKCWEVLGCPKEWGDGSSQSSADQGHFFNPEDHNVAEPESTADIAAAVKKAVALEKVRQESYERAEREYKENEAKHGR